MKLISTLAFIMMVAFVIHVDYGQNIYDRSLRHDGSLCCTHWLPSYTFAMKTYMTVVVIMVLDSLLASFSTLLKNDGALLDNSL